MAVVSIIAAATAVGDAALEVASPITVVCSKLVRGERVIIDIYGLAGDVEPAHNEDYHLELTSRRNFIHLPPGKYHFYKSKTAASLGVGYYVSLYPAT